jgi:hypothetical protein
VLSLNRNNIAGLGYAQFQTSGVTDGVVGNFVNGNVFGINALNGNVLNLSTTGGNGGATLTLGTNTVATTLFISRGGGGSGSQYGFVTNVVDDPTSYPSQNTHITFNSTTTSAANTNAVLVVDRGNSATNTRPSALFANNVGIGYTNAAPSYLLDINPTTGNGGNLLRVATSTGAGLYVVNNGNVGIGTTTPNVALQVVDNAAPTSFTGNQIGGIRINSGQGSTGNAYALLGFSSSNDSRVVKNLAQIGAKFTSSGSILQFGTSNDYNAGITNTALTIDQSGNVGIGTTTPLSQFSIYDNSSTYSVSVVATSTSGPQLNFGIGNTPSAYLTIGAYNGINNIDSKTRDIKVSNSGGLIYLQNSSGNVGIGTTTPGQTLTVAGSARITGALYDSTNSAGTYGMFLKSRFSISLLAACLPLPEAVP